MQQSATHVHGSRSLRTPFVALLGCLLIAVLLATVTGTSTADAQTPRLKDFARAGLGVGAVLHGYDPAWNDGVYSQVAAEEFNAVTATAYMPWGPWDDPNEPIDTSGLDAVVDWAQDPQHPMRVHAHGLVYPWANEQLDWWAELPPESGEHERLLEQYVTTMAAARAGDIWVWDVVNEVFADTGDSRTDDDGLRNDYLEYIEVGSDYVEKAFRWADAADPNALLIINDYGTEEINQKSTKLLRYATELKDQGVPIDGIGFQMHLQGHLGEPDYQSIRDNFARFAAAGFKLFITELDVMAKATTSESDVPTEPELLRQRSIYNEITRIAVEQPAVESLLMWDFADDRSWLQPTPSQLGPVPAGRYTFPTPWSGGAVGESMTKKPAYYGIIEALQDNAIPPTFPAEAYRITSGWQPETSFLTRSGDLFPGFGAELAIDGVRGGQWVIEDAGSGYHRLRNTWGPDTGYLTRQGILNAGGGYDPGRGLEVQALNVDWSSQLWRFEPFGNGQLRIRNAWEPSTGLLTRDGIPNGNGGHDPSGTASLYTQHDEWSSQQWSVLPVASASCGDGSAQAEDGILAGAMQVFSDGQAAGGEYVDAAAGTRNNRVAPDPLNSVEMCIAVDTPGRYRIDARVIAPDGGSDSFWVTVNGDGNQLWHIPQTSTWATRSVVAAPSREVFTIDLADGPHWLRFFHRETGTKLDSVSLVRVGGSAAQCSGSTAEAESGATFGTMQVQTDGTASGGQRVGVPASERNSYTQVDGNRLEVCVTVPSAGAYRVTARVLAPNNRSDSFWVAANGGASTVWHIPQSANWTNRQAPGTYNLQAGDNIIAFYARESGTFVDRISVSPS